MEDAVRSPELRRGGRRMVVAATKRAGWWIPLGVAGSLLWVGAKVLVPLAARAAIDDGFSPYDSTAIVKWCGIILVLGVCAALGAGVRWYCAFYVAHRTEHVLRSQLFAHLQQLHFGYHDRAQIGNLMARANLDLRQINQLVVFVPVFAANVVMVIAILAVLFTLNVKLTLLALISFPLLAVGAAWFQKLLDPVAARLQERLAEVSEVVEEGVAGIRVVKGFGAEQVEKELLDGRAEQVRAEAVALGRLRATFNPLLDLLPMVALVTVLYVGGKDAIDGSLTVGDLVAFSALLLQLVFPLRMTSYVVAQIAARLGVGRAGAGSDGDGAGDRRRRIGGSDPAGPGRGVVLGRVVRVPRRQRRAARLRPRDRRGRVGRVGRAHRVRQEHGGAAHPALLRRRRRHACCIDGHDVRNVRLGSLRREIGLVFEETFLFSDTVWENLAFAAGGGEGDADHERIVHAARARRCRRLHPRAARRLRHAARRARLLAVGWPAPAAGDRARHPRRPARPDPRRRHLRGRPHEGARDPLARWPRSCRAAPR